MEQNNSFERRVAIKIGLLFLIVILYVVGIFIYSNKLKRTIDSQKEEIAASDAVLSQSNRLILSVQEAQDALNAYLVNPQRKLRHKYDSIFTDISRQIIDIKQLPSPKEQDIYLENVDSLLEEKNKIVDLLIVQLRSKSPLQDLDKKMETWQEYPQDSVVVTTKQDTMVVVRDNKNFWSRLRNLVNPKQVPDTLVSIATVEQETHRIARSDTTIYADIRNITQEASKSYSSQIAGIEKQVRELILAEQSISLQISQLLTKFYKETNQITQQRMHDSEVLTRRIFMFAVGVGAISLGLIIIIILLIISDLNKGKKARKDLAKEKQLTESLMESRHKLLLSVSHDIKTPLTSIMGYMDMWAAEAKVENKKRQIQSAQSSGMHILSMLTNLLEFSRLERNTATLHSEPFDLVKLMNEIIAMFEPLTEEKNLEITFQNHTENPFFVKSDHTAIKQILINVVSNAVKYTSRGRIEVTLDFNKHTIITVSDTGVGMNESEIEEVYKPFSRLKNTLNAEGSGFGMYVTKGLIEALQGEIHIKSEKDKGTQVTLILPTHPTQEGVADNTSEKLSVSKKVLLFEDDIPLGNMIKEFLIKNEHKVKVCSDSRDVDGFINHLSQFDIVFTDMQMLHITGHDILAKIRKVNPEIPVWLLTAHGDYSREKAISEEFSGFIKKPIDMRKFVDVLSCETANHVVQGKSSLSEKFPELTAMFGNDTVAIKEILKEFVVASRENMRLLTNAINTNNFVEAQEICHRIFPFLCQIGAQDLCDTLRKMDSLRGQNETSYPTWREDLQATIQHIQKFTDDIEKQSSQPD